MSTTFEQRSCTAKKAAVTRERRNAFIKKYGDKVFSAVWGHVSGIPDDELVDLCEISRRSLAAIKANLTRGVYDRFIVTRADGTRDC